MIGFDPPQLNLNPRNFKGAWRIDPDFNDDLRRINQQAPNWQQQIGVLNAASNDIYEGIFGKSDFYDPRNYLKIGTAVSENIKPVGGGLMDQLMPNRIVDPAKFNNLDYLTKPMELFNSTFTPNFGEGFKAPIHWVNTVEGGPVIPFVRNAPEAMDFFALDQLGPIYTNISAIPPSGVPNTPVGSPQWAGMPTQVQNVWIETGIGSIQNSIPYQYMDFQIGYDPRFLTTQPNNFAIRGGIY